MQTSNLPYLKLSLGTAVAALAILGTARAHEKKWLGHDRTRPLPVVVDPGYASTPDKAGKAPSDAVVLFDGTDLSAWVSMEGLPTKWVQNGGAMECVPGSGYVRTLRSFGDSQIHLEFATPSPAKGNSQGRGNSGFFLGMGRYEVQILDSYDNKTYADGSCGSIYNQFPPLVNASRKPGEWQSYDIIWTAPKFAADGKISSAPRLTVFHNGVLIQNNRELFGETGWIERAPFKAHAEKLPLAFQDHGNPVRYRNVWVRELGEPSKPEYYLSNALLESYSGTYEKLANNHLEDMKVTRHDGSLLLKIEDTTVVLFAESPTHFFSKDVDIQADFDPSDDTIRVSVGEDGGEKKKRKI